MQKLHFKACINFLTFILVFVRSAITYAQPTNTFTNPILQGSYPDPSIVRVGEDYYMVNSSFEYFPGVPIWHSKDLVNWKNIGFAINDSKSMNYSGICSSCGIWAPSIRFHKGTYYLTVSWADWRMKVGFKNYLLTATDPRGPWSEPILVTDTIWGIDPCLFFDDDGKTYWLMNHPPIEKSHRGASTIMIQEFDLGTKKLINKSKIICKGAAIDSKSPEGPKLFKKDGYYYLMIAEGGTDLYHATTIFRSKNIMGDYENYDGNPILTHRHMRYSNQFTNLGHADLVQTQNNEWWLVCLGSRPLDKKYNIFGRETLLTPVDWPENDWPVVNPGKGMVIENERLPKLPDAQKNSQSGFVENFESNQLNNLWAFVRYPNINFHSFENGKLKMKLLANSIKDLENYSILCQRLRYPKAEMLTSLEFNPQKENEFAGMVLYKSEKSFLSFGIEKTNGKNVLNITERADSVQRILTSIPVKGTNFELKIVQNADKFDLYYNNQEHTTWKPILNNWEGKLLSVEQSGGFMGAFVGLYTTSNGKPSKNYALYDWFKYIEIK